MKEKYTIRIGKYEFGIQKRKQPIKEFQQLGEAVGEFKQAILHELEPILKPVCDFIMRQINRKQK